MNAYKKRLMNHKFIFLKFFFFILLFCFSIKIIITYLGGEMQKGNWLNQKFAAEWPKSKQQQQQQKSQN